MELGDPILDHVRTTFRHASGLRTLFRFIRPVCGQVGLGTGAATPTRTRPVLVVMSSPGFELRAGLAAGCMRMHGQSQDHVPTPQERADDLAWSSVGSLSRGANAT